MGFVLVRGFILNLNHFSLLAFSIFLLNFFVRLVTWLDLTCKKTTFLIAVQSEHLLLGSSLLIFLTHKFLPLSFFSISPKKIPYGSYSLYPPTHLTSSLLLLRWLSSSSSSGRHHQLCIQLTTLIEFHFFSSAKRVPIIFFQKSWIREEKKFKYVTTFYLPILEY